MKPAQLRCPTLILLAFALALPGSGGAPAASARDIDKAATETWRPKDGLYGDPRKDLDGWCADDERLTIALNKNKVVGYEWTCDTTKVTNTTSNSIRLDMTCTDINLAQSLYPRDPAAEERPFREVMLLDKIDEKTIFIRKTSNGKFRGRRWRATYCPDEQQRVPAGEKPTSWNPRDGVYASPGADFEERCLNSVDTSIDLAGKNITSGTDHCEVYSYNDAPMTDPVIAVVCNETHSTKGMITRKIDEGSMYGPPGFEVLRLRRLDDKTVSVQKTHNGISSPGRTVSYCSDEAQRRYRDQQKVAK